MTYKYLIVILAFYFLALLQNAFFAHFDLFGAVPNLVFIFFFLLVFFFDFREDVFYALAAGLFADLFSASRFGVSVVLLIIIGFLAKKTQLLLKKRKDPYPFFYFLVLFLLYLIIYELLLLLIYASGLLMEKFVLETAYNLFLASLAFYIFRFFVIDKK